VEHENTNKKYTTGETLEAIGLQSKGYVKGFLAGHGGLLYIKYLVIREPHKTDKSEAQLHVVSPKAFEEFENSARFNHSIELFRHRKGVKES